METRRFARYRPDGGWEGIPEAEYKRQAPEGMEFRSVIRRELLTTGAAFHMRYFEIGPRGYSSLERHDHVHAVVCLRGAGRVLVGDEIFEVRPFDFVHVPADVPHQFQNAGEEPFGFLCVVDAARDTPRRVDPDDLAALVCEFPTPTA